MTRHPHFQIRVSRFCQGGRVAFFLLLCAIPMTAGALQWAGAVSVSVAAFRYQERDEANRLLDEEEGGLPGIGLKLDAMGTEGWFGGAEFRYRDDAVDYRAPMSSSEELKSTTHERIRSFSISLGRHFELDRRASYLDLYGGLGVREWRRAIDSVGTIFGLQERYEWAYATLGVRSGRRLSDRDDLVVDLCVRRPFDTSLDVNFLNGVDDPVRLSLRGGVGFRLSLVWQREVGDALSMHAGPVIDYWRFDRNQDVPLTRNGEVVGAVVEPASTTLEAGIVVEIRQRW